VRFNGANASYNWTENNLFNLGGIVLQNGADLTLDRGNLGNNPSFAIQGACITIGAGSVLNLVYITELRNITICVEDGGKLIMDSRNATRNDYTLDGVQINLQGPNAQLEIGEADFILGSGGVDITGWTGTTSGVCPIATPNSGGSSGNISWTNESDGTEVCRLLTANNSCGPAGCDVVVNGGTVTGTIQDGSTICIRGNRTYAIDLQNRTDLTICVAAGVTFTGWFTGYNSSSKITVNVYGTTSGDLTINNSQSSFNVLSGGRFNSSGTLSAQAGTVTNQGTISNGVQVSNSATYYNSGTQTGQVTLSNSAIYTNAGTQSGQVTLSNTSSFSNSGTSSNSVTLNNTATYSNSGVQSGNVTTNNPNTSYTITSAGSQTGGQINITNGTLSNQGTISRPVVVSGNGIFSNSGTLSGSLALSGSGAVSNSGTMNLSAFTFDTNTSGMSFTNVSNASLTVSSSVTASGALNIQGNANFLQNLTLRTNSGLTNLTLSGNGSLVVGNTFDVAANSQVNLTNAANLSPGPTLTANTLNFSNDGGSSPRQFNVGENTAVRILDVATLQSGNSQLTIEGSFETGINVTDCKNTFVVSNNGGASPTRVQVRGEGVLDVTGSVSVSKHITAEDDGEVSISCNLVLENNGDNSLTVSDNVNLTVGGNTTLNKPMYVNGDATINLSGNLTLPNVASELVINDNSFFYVGGNTSVESPIRMNDNVTVTFDGNINLPNVGNAQIWTDDNADVLVTGNMTKSGGTVTVLKDSQLVFCNARLPDGTVSGQYPNASGSGMSISPSPAFYGGCRILPIEFAYFQAEFIDSKRSAKLSWASTKEWGNSHFEIERAVNSIKTWEKIGEVAGQGYSEKPMEYFYEDMALPPSGGNVFYRIKQVDFDGSYSYSVTRAIQAPAAGSREAWILFPNPSAGGAAIQIQPLGAELYLDEKITLSLITTVGEVKSGQATSPNEASSLLSEWMALYPPGIYLVQILWGSQSQQLKVIRK
jgi:hypothetical protein